MKSYAWWRAWGWHQDYSFSDPVVATGCILRILKGKELGKIDLFLFVSDSPGGMEKVRGWYLSIIYMFARIFELSNIELGAHFSSCSLARSLFHIWRTDEA